MQTPILQDFRQKYETELFEHVIPFWEQFSPDRKNGGYFNCLDRDGKVYDSRKHIWLQGREAWMFSKLYNAVDRKPQWLKMATLGIDFLRSKAIREDGRVYFSMTAEGKPVYLQRKIFSECFYIMALAEYSRAAQRPDLLQEAKNELEKVWSWAFDWTKVGRPSFEGESPAQSLAVPMILLNLIEEVAGENASDFRTEIEECIQRMLLHVKTDTKKVHEFVAPDGARLDSPDGRLLNPGHAIEAGWFLQHWAQRLRRIDLQQTAIDMVRWSYADGWDKENGGIYYFLDTEGYSPTQLEWNMKLWWPHCEALYAHLLNYSITGDKADFEAFQQVHDYTFSHFRDPEFGEWFGYLDRFGNVTHRFKGGPYKGCFHVPRALLLVWNKLQEMGG